MPGSSKKHPPDKAEFIVPKAYQYFKSLKHYLKALYSNVKAI